ncbi:bifunctional 23S rRNA (guanine(2069)-N(7))-methyltransferase RlmK/23S rRNA (guanine(2445)-N(2))-methyltransferase RlmL [Luminiphilus sp.]|nr:bifunctional 23S rRNA (guanine(2069)-N(7))-methyltransferase RlmK/23S rRNA (guanine(2445)-N(2))-methyltransferase RlmL [Luminiphilus sp.]MDA8985578.1 bifunctional 23S rRNA (guanine(2069)-N(7))-methyltransferase RlmK/23S rRNA (guanine(2445)-N(2))-methyltransferase RlmL [Luminiphilus sp.]
MMKQQYLATSPAGVGVYLAQELLSFGAEDVVERPVGVSFTGSLALAYRVCLWSRLANRIILQLGTFAVHSTDDIYEAVNGLDWGAHIRESGSLMVDFSGRSEAIRNAQFGAQKVKDAIVDRYRQAGRSRPSVDLREPDVRVTAKLAKGQLTIGIDLSGDSLHQRGYRLDGGLAPLKENIAAAALWAADWPARSRRGEALIDPMCGSATLLLEGALMALNRAPGLLRQRFGFEGWLGHDEVQWRAVRAEAVEQSTQVATTDVEIRGYDADISAVRRAQDNIVRLGLERSVRIRCKSLSGLTRPTHRDTVNGLLVMNPPWGERMGDASSLRHLYHSIGEVISREFAGWSAAVLTSDVTLGKAIGLRAHKRHRFQNGRLELHCLQFSLTTDNELRALREPPAELAKGGKAAPAALSEGAQGVANRIRKNLRHLKSWRQREEVTCYRVYDADIPEYAVAIDIYEEKIHIAEYAAPQDIPEEKAARRLEEVLDAVQVVFHIADRHDIALKQRRRQRGAEQYQRSKQEHTKMIVHESPVKALVNLKDYLDTGLFLDHRPLRGWLRSEAKGSHFLNLFSYTGVATLHAALGGATTSTSVDASSTYLQWFNENLALNGLSERQHRGVRADVRQWLSEDRRHYDLIMVDPPSFSNSSGLPDFDVQADHAELLALAMERLSANGTLYFSTNHRRFKLDEAIATRWEVSDVTSASIPQDFARNRRIHACFRLTHT